MLLQPCAHAWGWLKNFSLVNFRNAVVSNFVSQTVQFSSSRSETPRVRFFCALLTALLWWLSTLQSGLFALGWIAPLPLLWSLRGLNARARFFAGWRCGFFSFALLNWWIAVAITRGAPMIGVSNFAGFFLGTIGVFLIGFLHGLCVAVVAWFWNPLAQSRPHQSSTRFDFPLWLWPLGFASLWTLLDWARCSGPLAHSWGALAYSQWRDVALLQTASVVGQHGLTFVCVWFAASLALWLRASSTRNDVRAIFLAPMLAMLVLHVWGASRIGREPIGRETTGKTLRVLLVQTTANAQNGINALGQASELTNRATQNEHFDLIVWPETTFFADRRFADAATPIEYSIGRDIDNLQLRQTNQLSRDLRTPILSGVSIPTKNGARSNQALLFDGTPRVQSRAKTHLVPFGERAPWSEILPFLRVLAPSPQVEAGAENVPMKIVGRDFRRVSIGTLICFESCFAQPSRSLKRKGAQILLVLTNDEWSSGTEAPWQHAAMSAVRAAENGVPMAQSANGGICFAVDRWGRFVVKSRFNVPQTVSATLLLD